MGWCVSNFEESRDVQTGRKSRQKCFLKRQSWQGAFKERLHQGPGKHARAAVGEEFEVECLTQPGVELDPHVEVVGRRTWVNVVSSGSMRSGEKQVISGFERLGPLREQSLMLIPVSLPIQCTALRNSPLNFLSSACVGNKYALAKANAVTMKPTKFMTATNPLQFRGMKPGSSAPHQIRIK